MEHILLETKLRHMEDRDEILDRQHGFTRGKFYIINPVALYYKVTSLIQTSIKKTSKKSLMQTLTTYLSELERDGSTTQWIRNCLNGCLHRVVIKSSVTSINGKW